jgi:3-phosphoshikimate 1-carboxyvinyltransferase
MSQIIVYPTKNLSGMIKVDGDKSITHRAILQAGLAQGSSMIHGYLSGNDCQATIDCLIALGVPIEQKKDILHVQGRGLHGLIAPTRTLNCVRSGTTMRLLMGILSGQTRSRILLDGDPQLKNRPMERVAIPLRVLGAKIETTGGKPPIEISPAPLLGAVVEVGLPSAQIKSALIYAGLFAEGETTILQSAPTRDHTERMLIAQGANVICQPGKIKVRAESHLHPLEMTIPGDISSAAFPITAGVLCAGSKIWIQDVGLNPSRTGILDILINMSAKVEIIESPGSHTEPIGQIMVDHSMLQSMVMDGDLIVRSIDEIPLAALLATQADGQTVIRNAEELRVKETDRILSISTELKKMGARIVPTADGMIIQGPTQLQGTLVDGHGDHRIAMTLFIAGLIANGETRINGFECVTDSFPGFLAVMQAIGARYA